MPSVQASRITLGTCIVAIRTPNEVILGADSLERYSDGSKNEKVCKIVRVGNIVFAIAGVSVVEDDEAQNRRVNIAEMIRQALTSGSSIADSLAKLRPVLEKVIKQYFKDCSEEDQLQLLACLRDRVIEVVVCGMEDDSPKLSVLKFSFKRFFEHIDSCVEIEDIGVNSAERVSYFAGYCKNERIGRDLTGDLVSVVRRLIHYEIKIHEMGKESDRWCGGPIRIVRVDGSGVKWEPGDEVCD
jgi:hypothetical protein